MHKKRQSTSAQTMLEYLILMSLVAFLVFSSFRSNGILDLTRQATNEYFSTGTRAIMGGYYDKTTGKPAFENPSPINGGWCPWTVCINDMRTRECACPRAAFGGKECDGPALDSGCGGPLMEACPAGKGLVYVPGEGCVCPEGDTWVGDKTTGSCQPCISIDGTCTVHPIECGKTNWGKDNCNRDCSFEGPECPIVCFPNCSCAANTCVGNTCSDTCGGNCPGTKNPHCDCAANTCVGETCNNGCVDCPGTKNPDCSCAANTCVGETCSDGCGGDCSGTKNPDCSCAANTCAGETCNDGCGGSCPGTKGPNCSCAASTCVGDTCPDSDCGTACPGTKNPDCSCAANTCMGETCSDGCGGFCNGTKIGGSCTPFCKDTYCNGSENCVTCPDDCVCPPGTSGTGHCDDVMGSPTWGMCIACIPDCFYGGNPKHCGTDGCFGTCGLGCNLMSYYCKEPVGHCLPNDTCPAWSCPGWDCGGNGCGGFCGPGCTWPEVCVAWTCVLP